MKALTKSIFSFLILLMFAISASAQSANDVEMADLFHTSGKIYVVVAVLSVVFTGIVIFLISIDRKVSRLEKTIGEKK
ncbi:MAG: CcmD family protein [Bacteroidetes bacterium]|nr:CcmD family protein [Bacteroidota bacterium]